VCGPDPLLDRIARDLLNLVSSRVVWAGSFVSRSESFFVFFMDQFRVLGPCFG